MNPKNIFATDFRNMAPAYCILDCFSAIGIVFVLSKNSRLCGLEVSEINSFFFIRFDQYDF